MLAAAPDPQAAARLSRSRIAGALRRARRRDIEAKTERIRGVLGGQQLSQPPELAAAYAATVRATVSVITVFTAEITTLGGQVEAHFGRHPDAEIYRSQPGLGAVLGARVLGEFGDDPDRYAGARAPARTTPVPARSPGLRGSARPCSPASCATAASPTRCTSRRSAH
ncbi:MAG: hypothetical protein ACRDRZ_01565 [Pseudonocardiaceae bacterium]